MFMKMFSPTNLINFRGRASRREMFILGGLYFLGLIAGIYLLSSVFGAPSVLGREGLSGPSVTASILSGTFLMLVVALLVRRVHDQDRPWYFLLILLVPVIGQFLFIVAISDGGTIGENSYGPDPRGRASSYDPGLGDTFS